jgi:Mg2+ and Co2+ transporter CorA
VARTRSVTTRERDARALEFRRRGLNYEQIATQMGWRAASSAHDAVQRALADTCREAAEEVRAIEAARLDDLTRTLHGVLTAKHYVVAAGSGMLARHPDTGELLLDDGPIMQAVAGLLRISERRSKLLGLDAPTVHQVVTLDVIDAEIARLSAELAGDEAGASAPAP